MLHQQPNGGPDVRDVTAAGGILLLISTIIGMSRETLPIDRRADER